MVKEIGENYLQSSEYEEAHMNVLNEIPLSYSHQGNLELDQTSYTTKTRDHELVDLEVAKLLSRVYAFCEEGHAIMDCPFMPFHIRVGIARHVELQNVAKTLMDQPQEKEP
jgi:hypothetical protein